MPTFGFSAYLKLISLNEKPRGTAIRDRIAGGGGGYDFHRSMKRGAGLLLSDEVPLEDVLASLQSIKRAPELRSATEALKRLAQWRADNPGELVSFQPAIYTHPSGLFKVTFTPDFGVSLGGTVTAVHIWNTAEPTLAARTVYAALSLFPTLYENAQCPDDFALLSLREPKLYLLSAAGRYAGLGESMAEQVAEGFRKALDDLAPDGTADRPRAPPG